MSALLLLNGPNLNLLGTREPATYGHQRLADIAQNLTRQAQTLGHSLAAFQNNSEGALVDRIHQTREDGTACILFNPGAYTHTSIALRDALLGVGTPFIEIHLSNVFAREAFRHHSYLSDIAAGVIVGFGADGYTLALQAADRLLRRGANP
ncbi:MAG TPA: type II 3-dehydroquinate dehydratase [Nevskiaceae bacterium]|nr:type II 3-dehydroquinate dehydratase [Nevskiaceae bacterium]